MYKIIRSGKRFGLVIVVSPTDAGPDTPDAKLYRYALWQIGDHPPGIFKEISRDSAFAYFSGIADGIGFEELPEETFNSLDEILQYISKKRGMEIIEKLFELVEGGENILIKDGERKCFFLFPNPIGNVGVIDYETGQTYLVWANGEISAEQTVLNGEDPNPEQLSEEELAKRLEGVEELEREVVPEPA